MTYVFLIPVAMFAVTLIASAYFRYARTRLVAAARVWPLVEQSASKLISDKLPKQIREMAFQLGVTTGCGCFTFGYLIQHYVPPFLRFGSRGASDRVNEIAEAMKSLEPVQRRQLDALIAATLAYDMLASPIFGFFAIRAIKFRVEEAKRLQDLPSPTREAREAVFHTWGSESARRHHKDLCPA
jgi:hypothetical protein